MTTTIQVQEKTAQILKRMKEKDHLKTYDEVIWHLLKRQKSIPKSKFGAHPTMNAFTPEDEADFNE